MANTRINNSLTIYEGKEVHAFDLRDQKGREVGANIVFHVYTFEPLADGDRGCYNTVEPGTYFSWQPHATRNGECYGPIQNWNLCKTEAERHMAVEKYLKSAKARMARKFK
jgi:hypothetical protein